LARQLGAELLIVVSAAGGLNPRYMTGDVVVIVDHINMMCRSPAAPKRPHEYGYYQRDHYDAALAEQALRIARRENFMAHRGVYVAMTGPNYETRAEYRFLRQIGGDVVGMSTVPEVIVASQCGMRVLALSTVTNLSRPDTPQKVTASEVLQAASASEPHIRKIIQGVMTEQLGG
jgi:purine-nucleoside phosphorylase